MKKLKSNTRFNFSLILSVLFTFVNLQSCCDFRKEKEFGPIELTHDRYWIKIGDFIVLKFQSNQYSGPHQIVQNFKELSDYMQKFWNRPPSGNYDFVNHNYLFTGRLPSINFNGEVRNSLWANTFSKKLDIYTEIITRNCEIENIATSYTIVEIPKYIDSTYTFNK